VRRSETCYSCKFWVGFGVRERGPKGQCRRFPPIVTDRAPAGTFPVTMTTDWCGEWQRPAIPRVPEGEGNTLYDEL